MSLTSVQRLPNRGLLEYRTRVNVRLPFFSSVFRFNESFI